MSVNQMQRPNFFEGQYLGEEDLDLAVEYNRFRQSRHVLGAHTWGIATGLQFREEEAAGGGVEIAVQPGYAVDGYGRQIVLNESFALTADLFEGITGTASSVQVKVWIQFQGVETTSPDDLFKVCDSDDAFARLQEGFGIVVARQGTFDHDDLSHDVTVAGESVSALETPPSRQEDDPIHCDESVPYQTFPTTEEDPDQAWLIPLGYVRWNISTQSLEATTDDERYLTRTCRHYIGAVTEDILAVDGLIRLRHRETDPPADEVTPIDAACTERMLSDLPDTDLSLDADPARAMPIDLVWIEGNLRLIGDEKIYGGLIDFRNDDGDKESRLIRRVNPNSVGGIDLQLVIGDQTNGVNRLAVGPYTSDTEISEHFVVRDNGFTGVQVGDPEYALQVGSGDAAVTLALRGPPGDAAANVLAFEDEDGAGSGFQFVHNTADPHQLFLNSAGMQPIMTFVGTSGYVGVGTKYADVSADQPPKPLTVRGKGSAEELLGFENDDGELKWHVNQLLSGTRDGLNFVESGVKDGRLFIAAGGNTGINTVEPDAPLHIFGTDDDDATVASGTGLLVIGDIAAKNLVLDNNEIMARNNGAISPLYIQTDGGDVHIHALKDTDTETIFKDNGDLGLGTISPTEKLDVRGEIKLGDLGDYYAASAYRTIVIVAGRVDSNGDRAGGGGDQFTSIRDSEGKYRVEFDEPFDEIPSVVVSALDAPVEDNVMTVLNLDSAQFEVYSRDVSGLQDEDLQDSGFTFIAIGLR